MNEWGGLGEDQLESESSGWLTHGFRHVKGFQNVSIIGGSLGSRHTCVIVAPTPDAIVGDLKCFGRNSNGQLGLGDNVDRGLVAGSMDSLPFVDVGGKVKDVKCGHEITCVLLASNRVKCFGSNADGALGIESSVESIGKASSEMGEALEAVKLPFDIKAISVGSRTVCAVEMSATSVYCWGDNYSGALGQGHTQPIGASPGDMSNLALSPVPLNLPSGYYIEDIQTVSLSTCVMVRSEAGERKQKCWGANHNVQLGNGNRDDVGDTPESIGSNWTFVDHGNREVMKTVLGGFHNCAIFKSGQIGCFGSNNGQFGVQTAPKLANLATGDDMPVSSYEESVIDLALAEKMSVLMIGKYRELLHFEVDFNLYYFSSVPAFQLRPPIDSGFCPVTNLLEVAEDASIQIANASEYLEFYTIKNPLRSTTVVVRLEPPSFLNASETLFEVGPEATKIITLNLWSNATSTEFHQGNISATFWCKGDPEGVFALPDVKLELALSSTSDGMLHGVSWIVGCVGAILALTWLR